MRTPRVAAVLLTMSVAGCAVLPAGETIAPSATPVPSVQLVGDRPAFEPREATGYPFMLTGAGRSTADGTHAWVVGFGEQRGDQELIHLASGNGTDWQVADGRVEEEIGLELRPPGRIPSTVLSPAAGGAWVMYFSGSPPGGVDGADSWRATAPGPEGPWTADPEPVLARASVLAADGGEPTQLDFPAVVRTDEGYLMLFGWSPSGATTLIRSATSLDGVTWTVSESPAIDRGLCGGFDARSVAMPRMAPHPDGGWLALYMGFGADTEESQALGLARSPDGTSWSCGSSVPILEMGDIPGSTRVHSFALLSADGGPQRMLVESLVPDGSELWLAELRLD